MEETMVNSQPTETTEGYESTGGWDVDVDSIISEVNSIVDDGNDTIELNDEQIETPTTEPKPEDEPAATEPETNAEGEATKPEAEAETQPEPTPEPETFTLKHLGEERTVGRDEVIALAQQGMDYARIRDKLTESTSKYDELYNWMKLLAGNQSIEDFMFNVEVERAKAMYGLDNNMARERVKLDRERREFDAERKRAEDSKKAAETQQTAQNNIRTEYDAFVKAYPEVASKYLSDKSVIPNEVWAEVRSGKSLTEAYSKYSAKKEISDAKKAVADKDAEISRLKAELEAEKQNKKNKSRSSGSMSTDGGGEEYDPIAAGWNSAYEY